MPSSENQSVRRLSRSGTMPTVVKYWLPELLTEVEAERSSGQLGLEKLPQGEIAKLFKAKSKRRRVQSSS